MNLIPECDAIESKQWDAYEQAFKGQHEFSLALRYKPEGPEQTALVERFFPKTELPTLDDDEIVVTFGGVAYDRWTEDLDFDELASASVDDKTFGGRCSS